jgi:hypothetical protein
MADTFKSLRACKAELTKLEGGLYKSQPQHTLAQLDRIERTFDALGWPDWWSRVNRLRQDAEAYARF